MTDLTTGLDSEGRLGLVELVNRVLDRGAVISGDVLISVAGVDLIYVGLRVVITSAETMRERGGVPGSAL